jgi:LacI family transcriptional regulator
MITIKHIAEIAGVRSSTVSNVLQGRIHKMTQETLERVRQAISENNYVSNMSGRMLGRYGSKLIAVVMNFDRRDEINAMQDPFLGGIIGDLEHEIRKAGYFMMLYISGNVEESLRMAASWNVEGLIATGCNTGNCRRFMVGAQKLRIPIVFIDGYYYDDEFCFVNTGLQDRAGGPKGSHGREARWSSGYTSASGGRSSRSPALTGLLFSHLPVCRSHHGVLPTPLSYHTTNDTVSRFSG